MTSYSLEMKGIRKSFYGNEVLHGIDFACEPGKVHVLIGENGAGKSTMLKILTGVYQPDAGDIRVMGKEIHYTNTGQASEVGIAMVYQELTVFDYMSVAQNIYLGVEPKNRFGIIDYAAMVKAAEELIEEYDLQIDPQAYVGELPLAKKQMVEIMKMVVKNPQIIILDEPTSSLNREEVQKLYELIRRFKEENKTIIFISHRMEELFEIGDIVTVLKDGTHMGTVPIENINQDELIRMMIGRELSNVFPEHCKTSGEEIFSVEHISCANEVKEVSFSVKKGEIIGVAGLQGHGQNTLLDCIAGIRKRDSGNILLNQKRLKISNSKNAIREGIGFVSEDRKSQGLFLKLPVRFNLTVSSLYKRQKLGFIRRRQEEKFVQETIEQLDIKLHSAGQDAGNLSGGNQQKIVLGKVLAVAPKVLLFNEPTRGIDINTKHEIYKMMRSYAEQGIAVIMYSTDLTEIIGMSDRVLVMYEGAISGELKYPDITEEKIMRLAVGVTGGV